VLLVLLLSSDLVSSKACSAHSVFINHSAVYSNNVSEHQIVCMSSIATLTIRSAILITHATSQSVFDLVTTHNSSVMV
jgi:hypothetical protein